MPLLQASAQAEPSRGQRRYLREHLPSVGLFAVEPLESAVLSGNPAGPHHEHWRGFVPALLDRSPADRSAAIPGLKPSARRVMTEEGISPAFHPAANVAAALLPGEQTGMEEKSCCDGSARHR